MVNANHRLFGAAESVGSTGAGLTTNVTGTVCGLLEAPEEVMAMSPL